MAVAFDAQGTDVANVGTSFSDTSLTIGSGSNRALTVLVVWSNVSTPPTGVSITWNSVALTLVSSTSGSNTNGCTAIYALLNPASGAKTLAGSWTGSTEFYVVGVSWTGVDQTSVAVAFPHGNTSTGSTTAASLAITSAVGNYAVSIYAGKNNSGTNNQTLIFFGNANTTDAMGQYAAGAASVTFSSTLGTAGPWVMSGCDILAAGTADVLAAQIWL